MDLNPRSLLSHRYFQKKDTLEKKEKKKLKQNKNIVVIRLTIQKKVDFFAIKKQRRIS